MGKIIYKFFFFFLFFVVSCTTDYFKEAEVLQKQEKFLEAARYYEVFADKNPQHVLADIALYRAALIYSEKFEMCNKSLKIFEKIVREYPRSQFHSDAYIKAFICPDYFPLDKINKWYYGDSESGGKNAREIIYVKKRKDNEFEAEYFLYAGNKLVNKRQIKYVIEDLKLIEIFGKDRKPLIKYPLKKGMVWNSLNGNIYKVVDDSLSIKVRAGEFERCVKIIEEKRKSDYKMVYYYAPVIGKILTSMEIAKKENRIMELIKYE